VSIRRKPATWIITGVVTAVVTMFALGWLGEPAKPVG
jgi:hypothetical protein